MNNPPAVRHGVMRPDGSHLVKFVFDEDLPFADRGCGAFVYDTEGRRYLDGCSGAVTAVLGHADPGVLAAMGAQAERITFAHRGTFHSAEAERLAERLSAATRYPYVFLCNSGSEAVETALRLTLQYWQERGESRRSRFLSHAISYHGATLGGLSLSGHPERRRVAEALLHGFNELDPPYAYRYAGGLDDDAFTRSLMARTARVLDLHGPDVAGVMVEPVGGAAGGAITPPGGYLPALAELCRERGVPLIADEVMTGLGRTGAVLASWHWNVRPDLVVIGKGMGGGYAPVSAVLVGDEVVETIAAGSGAVANGHTYGGNPLGSAIAIAVLDAIEERGLVANAAAEGARLRTGLDELALRHEIIGEVRGVGLLQGLELVRDRETRSPGTPVGSLARSVVRAARDHGLLLYPATGGINDAVLAAPPLTSTDGEIDLLLELLDVALTELKGDRSA